MNKLFLVLILCLCFSQTNLSAQTAPIEITDLLGGTVNDCIVIFKVKGGMPSTTPSEKYKINAYLSTDNTVKALIHTPSEALTNGASVQFSVPQSGVYNIKVEDSAGATSIFTADMATCDGSNNINLSVPTGAIVGQGETYCFPITVKNFKKIATFAFSINWNKDNFQFSGIQNVNSKLTDFNLNNNITNLSPGQLGVSYIDALLSNIDFNDNETLLEICLSGSATLGACSDITLGASPTLLDFSSAEGVTYAATSNNGNICVGIVGVKEILAENAAFSCFPNPTNSNFTLQITDAKYLQNAQYQVVDLLGKSVKSGVVRDMHTNIAVNNLAAGLYEVRLLTPAGFSTQKLIVE
jgi:Secretion system C-terminal sorting domain